MKTLRILLMVTLIIGVAGVAPVTADLTVVPEGGVVFVGEEGLTFEGIPAGTTLAWYATGDSPGVSTPAAIYVSQGTEMEVIAPSTFQSRTGNWYMAGTSNVAINVQMPNIDVNAYNCDTREDVTNGRVVNTDRIAFRLNSNLYMALDQRMPALVGQNTDIKVVVVDNEGTTYTALIEDATSGAICQLTGLTPNTSRYYLPDSTGASGVSVPNWDLDSDQYKTGVYTFYVQVNLNGAKDNVGTVTGVTKSAVKTLEVGKNYVKIESNKDNIAPNNDFAVTICGRPNEKYVLWVAGSSSITAPDTVPYIKQNQDSVENNDVMAGSYTFNGTKTVASDVCQLSPASGSYYAMVRLSSSGIRTIGFGTDNSTKEQTYTIRTDLYDSSPSQVNDNVLITVGDPVPEPPAPFNESMTLKKGWNLISTPVDSPDIDVTGYLYETIYGYNAATGTYEEVSLSDIVPGEGYWVGAFEDAEIEFTGEPLTEYRKSLVTGWNLVGGIGIETEIKSICANPDALLVPAYWYNPETHLYSQAYSLEPGLGYWISSSEPCSIKVNITPPVAPK